MRTEPVVIVPWLTPARRVAAASAAIHPSRRFGFDRDWFGRFPLAREFFGDGETIARRPAIETRVEEGKFIVWADLPGIDPKDVDIKS